jgi:PAS domain S-box-containing protein
MAASPEPRPSPNAEPPSHESDAAGPVDESRAQLAAIVESSHDAIISKTPEGIVTSWNAAAERLFGYTRDEMVGQSVLKLIPPELQAEETTILARLRRGELIDSYETVRLRKDGTRLELSLTISPIRDSRGRITGASKIARDVGAARAAERVLRQSEERYRSLVEASGAIVLHLDETGRWLTPQPAWQQYTGQSFDDSREFGWVRAFHEDDLSRVGESAKQALALGVPFEAEARLWHAPTQVWRHQDVRAVPLRDSAGIMREWIGACLDVDARKEAEDALRTEGRRKDEFLAVLAHELRNPLAPIANTLEALRTGGLDATTIAELTAMAHRQLQHLIRLVDDLMEVSRITRGVIELRKEALFLRAAVQAAIEISQPLAMERKHRLEIDLPEDPLPVQGDYTRLTQVVANLLNNAAKYTPDGGVIRLSLRREGRHAVVRVADNGAGIPADMLTRVFDMFTRVDRAIERLQGGLGIGLSLAKRLVELHGGTIEARSEGLWKGSEFIVKLPLADEAPKEDPADKARARLPACRVLVADDNRDAARVLELLLRAHGQDVHVAHDGAEAVERARLLRPDVVLLDLGMPVLTGYEAARRIRAEVWGRDMLLVALTGWGQEEDRVRTKSAGFDQHLVKPVSAAKLQELLATARAKSGRG